MGNVSGNSENQRPLRSRRNITGDYELNSTSHRIRDFRSRRASQTTTNLSDEIENREDSQRQEQQTDSVNISPRHSRAEQSTPHRPGMSRRRVEPPRETVRRRRRRNWLFGLLAHGGTILTFIFAVILLGMIVFAYLGQRPENAFKRYHRNLIREKYEFLDLFRGEGLEKQKIAKQFTISAQTSSVDANLFLDRSEVRIGLDTTQKAKILNLQADYIGQNIIDITSTYKDGMIGYYMKGKDEEYYVSEVNKFIYELTGEDINLSAYMDNKISDREKRKLFLDYFKLIFSAVKSDNIKVEPKANIVLDQMGDSFNGTLYTFKPSSKDIEETLLALATKLESDEKLVQMIQKSGMDIEILVYLSYIGNTKISIPHNAKDMVRKLADTIRSNAAEIANRLEVGGFTWEAGVEKGKIRYIKIGYSDSTEGFKVYGYEAKEMKDENNSIYFFTEESSATVMSLSNSFTREKSILRGSTTLILPNTTGYELDYDVDTSKKSLWIPYGKYDLNNSQTEITTNLRLDERSDGNLEYLLTFDNMDHAGYPMSRLIVTMQEEDDKKLILPEKDFYDISNLSSIQYQQILDSIESYLTRELKSILGANVQGNDTSE